MNDEQRGQEARRWLDHPLHKEAYERLEKRIVDEIAKPDCQRRDELCRDLSACRRIRTYIAQIAVTGDMIALEDQRKQTLKERMRNLFPA